MLKGGITKLRINSAGVIEILQSKEVAAELRKRGEGVLAALPTDQGEEWAISSFTGHDRAQVTVRTANFEAQLASAEKNALQRALSGGR